MNADRTVISAMCVVNDSVWLAESTGILRIYRFFIFVLYDHLMIN